MPGWKWFQSFHRVTPKDPVEMPEDMAFQEKATIKVKTRRYYIIESEHINNMGYRRSISSDERAWRTGK
jgi:hypothetical protein